MAEPPALSAGEAHVWLARLNIEDFSSYASMLAPEETERANRFRFLDGKKHYTVTRGLLRFLLGNYLKVDPAALRFVYSRYGKPALESPSSTIRFNVSHSHGLGLLAFQLQGDIGVDVEQFRPAFATQEIADRFFATEESAALRELSDDQRPEAFFRCWTLKEAVIKAHGMGFSLPLSRFVVSITPTNPRLLKTDYDPAATERWELSYLPVPEGFFGSVATEGKQMRLRLFELAAPAFKA